MPCLVMGSRMPALIDLECLAESPFRTGRRHLLGRTQDRQLTRLFQTRRPTGVGCRCYCGRHRRLGASMLFGSVKLAAILASPLG